VLDCCWSSPAQWFFVLSPTRLITVFLLSDGSGSLENSVSVATECVVASFKYAVRTSLKTSMVAVTVTSVLQIVFYAKLYVKSDRLLHCGKCLSFTWLQYWLETRADFYKKTLLQLKYFKWSTEHTVFNCSRTASSGLNRTYRIAPFPHFCVFYLLRPEPPNGRSSVWN
jgi:hypothetical protein